MSIVYLNGEFVKAEEAKISPMDRGFLFGDAIYEVIPSYSGNYVGFEPHIKRMLSGLAALEIEFDWNLEKFRKICDEVVDKNQGDNLGVYIQVSRGADIKRFHAYPQGIEPTVFVHCFEIPPAPTADKALAKGYRVNIGLDMRWSRCDIKSTSLLGNIMHFQQGISEGYDETILFDENDILTEASASNVFIVEQGAIKTPRLDQQKLAGITRSMLIQMLNQYSDLEVQETDITREQLLQADEVWLTSATKQIAPVINVAGQTIGNGEVGDVWESVQSLFSQHQFETF